MLVEIDAVFLTADGFECTMHVNVDATIYEDSYHYKIVDMEMTQFHGQSVSVILDEVDVSGEIGRQIDETIDGYLSEHAWELQQAEAEYFHDLAYDRWKEGKDYE